MAIRYPDSIVKIGRAHQTLAADSAFTALNEQDFEGGASPMALLRHGSGLRLNCADSEKDIGGSGTIEASKLADVRVRTEIAYRAIMKAEQEGVKNTANKNILDTTINFVTAEMSANKGKPARNFIDAGYSVQSIGTLIATLRQNAARSPKYAEMNDRQADALEAAMVVSIAKSAKCADGKLLIESCDSFDNIKARGSELQKAHDPQTRAAVQIYKYVKAHPDNIGIFQNGEKESSGSGIYVIYDAPQKTPNIKRVDADGMTRAYSLKVTCNPARLPYPFHVELTTFRGKPRAGQLVGVTDCTDYKTFRYDLQPWEWMNIVDAAETEKNITKLLAYPKAKKAADAARQANIEAARNK